MQVNNYDGCMCMQTGRYALAMTYILPPFVAINISILDGFFRIVLATSVLDTITSQR